MDEDRARVAPRKGWGEAIAAATPDEKWLENFSTSKEETLKWVDERIDALRKQLGLAPWDE